MGEDGTSDKIGSQVIDNGELVMPDRMIQSKTRARVAPLVLGILALALSVTDTVESAERQ